MGKSLLSKWRDQAQKRKAEKEENEMERDMKKLMEVFNSDSGGTNTQSTSAATPANPSTASGGLFGNLGGSSATQQKPSGGLFGNLGSGTTSQPQQSGQNMFSGLGLGNTSGAQQQSATATTSAGGGLFGGSLSSTSQAKPGGLFSGLGANTSSTPQTGNTGGGLFGNTGNTFTAQTQSKSLFGGLGSSTTGGGPFGGNQSTAQQQQQKPTLSLFGGQNPGMQQQPQQQTSAAGTVVPGVKVDVSNLLPTTKFESCADELKKQIETIDTFILNQIHMCNEVSDLLPTIANQGSTIPNDVEFVQGKLDTMQHALENDASDIDHVRKLVSRDAAEAQVAFRAIDTLKLPMQYQPATSSGWWSLSDQQLSERQSLRSTLRNRKSTLALPDDVEADPSTAESVNGVPVNLVDYFSQRSDEMGSVLDTYKRNIKEIEDHLYGVELTLQRQINEFVSSRSREGAAGGAGCKTALNELAAVLADVEAGIFGVASRLGSAKEEVQELVLGPPALGGRLG
ncbi:nucleoporin NUP49/NSP49 [Paecilomyces variotii No. 5]|uniref:Nucleoporin NUP49/NSP49 n=1 Tax=Byssochlamys spectabilis (strain No. 5 / NBRC 109023) TaxID=1356009 RepID=V5HXV3_BYSSN|nr:nucleoporin NUP49/NSP49 [Paecilomyces variotii No. 5]